jgi:uncharacterized heparinase superfamily protein
MNDFFNKVKRILKKPPRFIFERLLYEIKAELGRFWEPYLPTLITSSFLLRKFKSASLEGLWSNLAARPFCTECLFIKPSRYETLTGDTRTRVFNLAEAALENKVDLLGSGPIFLGNPIDWSQDYKSSFSWKRQYFRSISYSDLEKPNDVKFPWEISRMQWMIPLGQAYLLTKDETYAQKVKELLLSWIESNPYASSVNWACTMDVALRGIVWTWFFHVFKESPSWQDPHFRWTFLKSLYLHGIFISRHLEKSDVNGNHYAADAAGFVFIGLFFGKNSWHEQGWRILQEEIQLQVFEDGVDFEASIPYHRLVQELFFFPAQYRLKQGLEVSSFYEDRLCKMAYFTAKYSRLDGSSPLWGDADDARVLPFGDQTLNDHRYLIGLVGSAFRSDDLLSLWSGSNTEKFWIFGTALPVREKPLVALSSQSFPEGGFYIMRDDRNHIFIDCGPLGLKGRGGHGHNDILSFEAILDHTPLITDCGAFVYTADYVQRNLFRSTSFHNTPQIDGEEINRFIRPDYLWNFHHDALPSVDAWTATQEYDLFRGSHTGYERLKDPVRPIRTIKLDHNTSELTIEDVFKGKGKHKISVPFHFHPLVFPEKKDDSCFFLRVGKETFSFQWESEVKWEPLLESARYSSRYGIVENSHKIVLAYEGAMEVNLRVKLSKTGQP